MSKILYIAASCGVSFVIWGMAFLRHDPPPTPPPPQSPSLQQRWDDGQFNDEVVPLVKGPRLVQTVKVSPEPVEVVEVKPLEQPAHHYRKKVKRERTRSDVCSRHHMRKVMIGKYKWRCRR